MNDNSLEVLAEQFWHSATKQPGWVPLLAVMYAAVSSFSIPKNVVVAGLNIPVTTEVLTGLLTFEKEMVPETVFLCDGVAY